MSSAPVSDVPAPVTPADRATPWPAVTPLPHTPGRVETRWPTVEAATEYRKWLEDEAVRRADLTEHDRGLKELTRGERKILRLLQRDPRTREHPTDPLAFKRIADARVKRRSKAARRAELARRSVAGAKARARALPRPDVVEPVDASASQPTSEAS